MRRGDVRLGTRRGEELSWEGLALLCSCMSFQYRAISTTTMFALYCFIRYKMACQKNMDKRIVSITDSRELQEGIFYSMAKMRKLCPRTLLLYSRFCVRCDNLLPST